MGLWYWLGVVAGLGVALGAAFAGPAAPLKGGMLAAALLAAAAGYALALVFVGAVAALGGAAGGAAGAFAAARLCRRTLDRGGTRAATAALLVVGAVALGGLAWVPVLGYVEVVAVSILGLRLGRGGDRFAGLRTLARD